jgi:hypothetical protein
MKVKSWGYCPIGLLVVLVADMGEMFAASKKMTPASLDKKLRVPVAVKPLSTSVDAVEV